jgi:acetyltransferase-like isoleucine patch superfamily enzyme
VTAPVPARFLTGSSLRWVIRHRAWSWRHLISYWRLMLLRVRHRDVIVEGLVMLGRDVRFETGRGAGRVVLGRFVHLGDGCRIRAHEGNVRIGDKVVLGGHVVVNAYLDVEIGATTIVADAVHITDFDHTFADLDVPIKDQGISKSPVRIGPNCWLGTKVTVVRGAWLGEGVVVGANSVVTGHIPDRCVVGGVPARLIRRREGARSADGQGVVEQPERRAAEGQHGGVEPGE